MASIGKDKNGRKRILFVAEDKSRKTIRLGKMSLKQAQAFKLKLEAVIAGRYTGIDAETARWVAALPDDIHRKLEAVGLVTGRAATMSLRLGQFLSQYCEGRSDVKQGTQLVYERTRNHLIKFFGAEKILSEITPGDADEFRLYLLKLPGKQPGTTLSENTIRRTSGLCRQFFNAALRRKMIDENPFGDLPVAVRGNKEREYFVTREEAAGVLEACPDGQWRLLFALARYGGLRNPSETLELRWSDVDWGRSRMTVHSCKTEHHEGGAFRLVPIFPELHPYLRDAYEQAESATAYVITRYRKAGLNLRTQLLKIIRRAGLQPWPKLWQNLRATRQTELEHEWPSYIVCAWMGNSPRIAKKHYLQVTDEHFQKAAHFPAQYPAANHSKPQQNEKSEEQESAFLRQRPASCGEKWGPSMGGTGLEPVTSCVSSRRSSQLS